MYSSSVSFEDAFSKNAVNSVKTDILNNDACLYLGLMLTSPCAAVEFIKIGTVEDVVEKEVVEKE